MFLKLLASVVLLAATLPALALEKQPTGEYHARRVALAAQLKAGPALIFGADAPEAEYLTWRQDEDFYYLTGWDEPGAALLIIPATAAVPANEFARTPALPAQPYREILFLPERNRRMELYTGEKLDAATPGGPALAGVDEIKQIADIIPTLVSLHFAGVTIESEDSKATTVSAALGSAWGRKPFVSQDLHQFVVTLRNFKSPGEIELLRKAANASVAAHRALFTAIKPEVSERTMSGLIDYKLKENGCERPSYPSIVGSGIKSTELHYSADDGIMHAGDLVVVDAAGEYSMYASDVTRTFPASGHFTPRQREIYNIVLGAQRAAMDAFVAGKSTIGPRTDTNALDHVAFEYINTHGKDLHGEPLGKYFIHGVGHPVGINVHDPPDRTKKLDKGSVFTIEPGIYIPEEKIGVRIEDTYYVDSNGKLVDFISDLPHTAEEVEAAMNPTSAKPAKKH